MLLQTTVSGIYCQLFINKVDADMSQPGFVLDELIVRQFSSVALQ